ncbi:putative lumazine-binding protein [Mycena sanguinolenta]|uniref:Putative lumazine-binding protein n=1 Tax=Mycena sanguinolenta TaxID=230812 RepID=A0A8H7CUA0_9AGAR|nr:putative lumazine-binding protein [Mycena sanguinolenta]
MRYSTAGFSDEQMAVLAVVEKFLQGVEAHDKNLMLAQILPSGAATLLRNEEPLHLTLTGLVERIFNHPKKVSEIISGQPIIAVDRNLAMLWAPYEFFFDNDNVIDHVGTAAYTFAKQDGKWLISSVADNSHPGWD